MADISKTYFIKTFGCQANEADSERLAALLEKRSYRLVQNINEADLVIINSCSVRESAENRVFGLVNNLVKNASGVAGRSETKTMTPARWKKKTLKIVLTGCMVGSAKGERRRYSLTRLKKKLPQVNEFMTIRELLGNSQLSIRNSKVKALVPIMEGCDHFCSYCVVPYARGKEISRPVAEIICEVKKLAKSGYKEVTLLGQNVNSYHWDGTYHRSKNTISFADLLKKIHEIKGLKKISFITSNPWDLTDEIIEAMALPKIDRYLHLPVQSGDDQILKKMNRPYTAPQYIKLVEKIRKKIPDIQIGTDIIVGFPGETARQFENTVNLCRKVGFVKAYISKYSPRPGTAAYKLKDDVPPAEKKRRWQILERLINNG